MEEQHIYDRCYECRLYGDDYYYNDNGNLICACDACSGERKDNCEEE